MMMMAVCHAPAEGCLVIPSCLLAPSLPPSLHALLWCTYPPTKLGGPKKCLSFTPSRNLNRRALASPICSFQGNPITSACPPPPGSSSTSSRRYSGGASVWARPARGERGQETHAIDASVAKAHVLAKLCKCPKVLS